MRASSRIFLCGFITFFIEFLLIRIFDVILYPEISYVTIPLAFLGFSLAAWHRAHFKIPKNKLVLTQQWALPLMLFLFRPTMNLFVLSSGTLWQNLLFFALLFLFCVGIFYVLGQLLLELYFDQLHHFHKLYFFDLAGGALGIAAAIWLPKHISPGHLIYLLIAFWLCVPLYQSAKEPFRISKILIASLFIILAVGFPYDTWSFKNKTNKRNANSQRENELKVMQLWDPVSFIEIYKSENTQTIMFDGGYSRSSIYEFDGNQEKLKNNLFSRIDNEFWNRTVVAPYWLKPAAPNVLILTGVGGQEIKAALTFSAKKIQVVDIVSSAFDLNRTTFSAYNGDIFNRPEVEIYANEARYFLRTRGKEPYDIIQIFSASTSSSVGNISGGLRTINLLTIEAFNEYFKQLKPDGILHISRGFWPRILLTADASFRKNGLGSIYPHVVVFDDQKNPDLLPAVFFKKQAWTTSEIQKLQEFFSRNQPLDEFQLVFDPLHFDQMSWQSWQEEWSNLDPKHINLQPPTDDKPFFGILLKSLILPSTWPQKVKEKASPFMWRQFNKRSYLNIHSDFMPLVTTFLLSIFLAALFFLKNKLYFKKTSSLSPSKNIFFFSIGFAYFIIFYCIQYLTQRWIGRPDFSLFLSAVCFFVGTGIGSLILSPKINKVFSLRWFLVFIVPVCYLAYTCLWLNWQFSSDKINLFVVSAIIFLLGICLGPIFSSSLKIFCEQQASVAQAWLLNSYGALCASLISVLTVIFIGFHSLMVLACCGYALAYLCLFFKPKVL